MSLTLLKVEPVDRGNVRALVKIETPDRETINARIIKQSGFRAYLDAAPHQLTHRDKRHIQRKAVTAWADAIGDTLPGLLESERVFKGCRFNRLGVQLKTFCPVCTRNTPSEFLKTETGLIRNACYFCGTLRKGRPFIGRAELERIEELNARQGTGEHYEQLA